MKKQDALNAQEIPVVMTKKVKDTKVVNVHQDIALILRIVTAKRVRRRRRRKNIKSTSMNLSLQERRFMMSNMEKGEKCATRTIIIIENEEVNEPVRASSFLSDN